VYPESNPLDVLLRPATPVRTQDPANLTAEESCIMPSVSGGLEQADNAQAGMDVEAHRIVEQPLTQHPNDP
jgi:hypothetical protein